ncbi:MAG: ATP-binding protein [Bacteroidaceae bacterium]|nr:ATP-binding protein [Bacteroidaceae bacterium]
MKYPIGIQNFGEVRRDGYVYVDKTALMWKMVDEGKYYFLSRPRRFGKSLLLSTMEAFFSGERELFRGLYVDGVEWDWKTYPIMHLDLNTEKYDTPEALHNMLEEFLSSQEERYGRNENERSYGLRFQGVLRRAFEKTGLRVVILVDEYDKPMLQAIGNEELQAEYRGTLKAFYGALKSSDRYIRFAFLTGVTKFGKVSVFSDLNNLEDISMLPQYSTICGISEDELRVTFDKGVGELAETNGMTKEECYARLRREFDGYHFNMESPGMYNPFSLLNTLKNKHFNDYWFETGTPSFLVYQLKKTGYPLDAMTTEELSTDTLNSIDIMDENPLPLLYQSGYLTLKSYDKEFDAYTLGFPNREVEQGFIKYLLPFYTPKTDRKSTFAVSQFVKDVRSGDAEGFMHRLQDFFADGDYQVVGNTEKYFQNTLYVFFRLLGFYVNVERRTSNGRIDVLIQTPDYIYILELKINQTAAAALQQIEDKGYALPFASDSRQLFKIGINFSTETKLIDDWKVAEA